MGDKLPDDPTPEEYDTNAALYAYAVKATIAEYERHRASWKPWHVRYREAQEKYRRELMKRNADIDRRIAESRKESDNMWEKKIGSKRWRSDYEF